MAARTHVTPLRRAASIARWRGLLEAAYLRYDARWIDPDPVQFVWRFEKTEDREVVGLIASSLAYGNVRQIKRSVEAVLSLLGPEPARAIDSLDAKRTLTRLRDFKHRFNDGRDAACLLLLIQTMRREAGSIDAFFGRGLRGGDTPLKDALQSFTERTLSLRVSGIYEGDNIPLNAGVRFFFPSPSGGSACKRQCLYLRWMVREGGVDPGGWTSLSPSQLVIPLDAHIITIAKRVRFTRRVTPSWAMAEEITGQLALCDPEDPVKYDFALHRMGLFKKHDDIEALRRAPYNPAQSAKQTRPARRNQKARSTSL